MLPTGGLQNFVPDPSTLVSTNYMGLPAQPGLPAVGPGTTMFPGIPGMNMQAYGASQAGGSNPPLTSITKNYAPQDPMRKKAYAEELKRQMFEKDARDRNERQKQEDWDEYHERRIARDMDVSITLPHLHRSIVWDHHLERLTQKDIRMIQMVHLLVLEMKEGLIHIECLKIEKRLISMDGGWEEESLSEDQCHREEVNQDIHLLLFHGKLILKITHKLTLVITIKNGTTSKQEFLKKTKGQICQNQYLAK